MKKIKIRCNNCQTLNSIKKDFCYMCGKELDKNNIIENKTGYSINKKIIGISIALIIIVLFFCSLIFFLLFCNLTATQILNKMNKSILQSNIEKTINYTKENDINGLLGKSNQYISKSSFKDKRIDSIANNLYTGGSIEVFNNEQDALLRKYYLDKLYEKTKETFTKDKYGEKIYKEAMENCEISNVYVNKNCLIKINSKLNVEQIKLYKNEFDKIVNKTLYFQKQTLPLDKIEEIKKKYDTELSNSINELKKNIDKTFDDTASNMDKNINNLYNSLDEKLLNEYKDKIETLKIGYYNGKYDEWKNKLNDIEKKINENKIASKKIEEENFKNNCKKFSYSEISRNPDDLKGEKAFFEGKVVQVIESNPYLLTLRVNITPTYSTYIDPIWNVTIYVTLITIDGMKSRILKNDIINIWGILMGLETYTSTLGANITIPKVSAQYIEIKQ